MSAAMNSVLPTGPGAQASLASAPAQRGSTQGTAVPSPQGLGAAFRSTFLGDTFALTSSSQVGRRNTHHTDSTAPTGQQLSGILSFASPNNVKATSTIIKFIVEKNSVSHRSSVYSSCHDPSSSFPSVCGTRSERLCKELFVDVSAFQCNALVKAY